jgi:hypothetical protein
VARKTRNHLVSLLVLVALLILFLVAAFRPANAAQADPEVARQAAQGHIDAVAVDFPSEYSGARVTGSPTLCFDLDANLSAYIFSVAKNGRTVGYVSVGADDKGPSVIESSRAISPVEKRLMLYKAKGKSEADLAADLARGKSALYYLGGIEYYVAVADDQKALWKADFVHLADFEPVTKQSLQRLQDERLAVLTDPRKTAEFNKVWQGVRAGASSRHELTAPALKAGTLQVTWPSAPGQFMNRGTQYAIAWTAASVGSVLIQLYKGSSAVLTIAGSIPAGQGTFQWTPPSTTVPGADYRIKISDTANSAVYDFSDSNFYITGSKRVPGIEPYAYTWYRGCVITAETMVMNYIGSHGFPDLYSAPSTFSWTGAGQILHPRIARPLADLLGDAMGVPQSGGSTWQYGVDLPQEVAGVRQVARDLGYGSWNTQYTTNPLAETYRAVVDKNRPGEMGFYGGLTTYQYHATTFVGYSFYTNALARNWRVIYVFDTWDFGSHEVVYENQTGTDLILDYHEPNPPLMVVKYPSAPGIALNRGQACLIKWGSWAGQTGSTTVRIDLYVNGVFAQNITPSTPNTGSFSWTPSFALPAGSAYKIKITSTANASIFDYSDNNFTIGGTGGMTALVVDGPTLTGNITPAGDADWYVFSAALPGIYVIETWPGTLPDNYMELCGPNNQTTFIESDDDDGTSLSARISRYLTAGTYYVKIRAYSATATGTYTINLKRTVLPILTVNGPAVSGNISPAGDKDWFQFAITTPMLYTIETFAGTLNDTYMYLYGPNSRTVFISENDDGGSGYMSKIIHYLAAETYFVKVGAYSSSAAGTYSIRLTSGGNPVALTVNGPVVAGNISPAGDADWYRFTVTTPMIYTIETSPGSLTDSYMYLYGPNTATVLISEDDESGIGSMSKIVHFLGPGTYYVKIEAYSPNDMGIYSIRLTSSGSPVTLTVNGPAAVGNISPAGDADCFQFTATTTTIYTIETMAGTLDDTSMYLYGPNSAAPLIEKNNDGRNGFMPKIIRVLAPGTYYVKVQACSTSDVGTYSIRVATSGNPVRLTVNGAAASGNITTSWTGWDRDWFSFTVAATAGHTIETTAGTLRDSYMYLYGPNDPTRYVAENDDIGDTNWMSRISQTLTPGTYYVLVEGYGWTDTGTYTLRVSR